MPSVCVSVRLPRRLAGAGGRKKIFRLSDVLKPLTDAQVEAMKLGAVKRILRAEKAVACSGAAQVRPCLPCLSFLSLSPELTSQQRDRPLHFSKPLSSSVRWRQCGSPTQVTEEEVRGPTCAHSAQGCCEDEPHSEGCWCLLWSALFSF